MHRLSLSPNSFRIEPFWRVMLRELGISGEELARFAGLPANLFASESPSVDLAGWVALWESLDTIVGRPDLALQLASELSLDMFDPALFAAFCSKNLSQAASRLQLYKRLLGPCRLGIEDNSDGLALSFHVSGASQPPKLYGAAELTLWVALARHATRHRIVPLRVEMPFAPEEPEAFATYFGVPVTVGQDYKVMFAPNDSRRDFVTADPNTWAFFEPVLARRLADLDERTPMSDRVTACLVELLPAGRSQVVDVAKALGTSVRTMQRRLGGEGTSYREVLDQTRERLARHYLAHGQISTTEIALLLGFDDPNSFYPAFRSWTGMTPQQARTGP